MAGLSGKAGQRKIRGTVVGGATYSELTKNEGLTREQVMKVVEKHQAQIQMCYERALLQNPDIVGRAEFEWEIAPKGHVTQVKVKEATVRNGEVLLDCVKGVFASMKFPEAKNGESTTPTIGLPFGRL
jgi:Ni,Fe-hydrogenase III large subunit